MKLFLRTSNLVTFLGVLDLLGLIAVFGLLVVGSYISDTIQFLTLAVAAFYTFIWINKLYFTARVAGGAFPAVFGIDRHGEFNINVLWYVFSVLVLICLTIMLMYTILQDEHVGMVLISTVAVISCGRSSIPALVMGNALAATYARKHEISK